MRGRINESAESGGEVSCIWGRKPLPGIPEFPKKQKRWVRPLGVAARTVLRGPAGGGPADSAALRFVPRLRPSRRYRECIFERKVFDRSGAGAALCFADNAYRPCLALITVSM